MSSSAKTKLSYFMSTSFSYLNFGNWDQISDNGNTMSESGVTKNVRSGLNTHPWHLFYKEVKDMITQFLSQTLTEHYSIQNCEHPNKYLLQNCYCYEWVWSYKKCSIWIEHTSVAPVLQGAKRYDHTVFVTNSDRTLQYTKLRTSK